MITRVAICSSSTPVRKGISRGFTISTGVGINSVLFVASLFSR